MVEAVEEVVVGVVHQEEEEVVIEVDEEAQEVSCYYI